MHYLLNKMVLTEVLSALFTKLHGSDRNSKPAKSENSDRNPKDAALVCQESIQEATQKSMIVDHKAYL